MDISRPQFNHIRFDPQISLIKEHESLKCVMDFQAMVSPPNEDFDKFILSARCTYAFYDDKNPADVASYLGEVYSVVENASTPNNDSVRLLHLSQDFYNGFLTYVHANARYLGMDFAPHPSYKDVVEAWLKILLEQEFYRF